MITFVKYNLFVWVLRLTASIILLQTLYFKFSAAQESVYIFTKLHAEPWGRIGSGIAELSTGILLLIPRTTIYGAIAGMLIMAGAILAHVLIVGIVVLNDDGSLFLLAAIVFVCCTLLFFLFRKNLAFFNSN